MSRKRKPDTTEEVSFRDLSPDLQEQVRQKLTSPEHQAYMERQKQLEAARRAELDADYQRHLRRERLREAEEEQRLVERERHVFGMAQHKPTGRPIEITWEMVRKARQLLRSEGKKGTQAQVADKLGCTVETVKRRAQENGGWSLA